MFRSKQTAKNQTRRPSIPVQRPTQAVFSYHAANRSAQQQPAKGEAGSRRSVMHLWAGKDGASAAMHGKWRSVVVKLVLIAVLLLGAYSLVLNRSNPQVIIVAPASSLLPQTPAAYEAAARALLASSFMTTNKVTFNAKDLERQFARQHPELEQVSIALPFFGHDPIFRLQPAQPVVLIKTAQGGLFVLGSNGRVLAPAAEVKHLDKLSLTVVEDQTGLPATPGKGLLPSSTVAFITEVAGQLKAKKIAVQTMVLIAGTDELDVRVVGQPYLVKFNLHGDARAAVGTFLAVKQQVEHDQHVPASYIDVRVDNRAYYK